MVSPVLSLHVKAITEEASGFDKRKKTQYFILVINVKKFIFSEYFYTVVINLFHSATLKIVQIIGK